MKKFNDLSPQYKYQIIMTGLRKCPACGGKPSPRSPKRGYCDRHIETRAAWKRKNLGCKTKFVAKDLWVQLDWTLGPKLMAVMLGVSVRTVKDHYKRLLAEKKIKPVPGFLPGRWGKRRTS